MQINIPLLIFTAAFATIAPNLSAESDINVQLGIAAIATETYIKGEKDNIETLPYFDIAYGRWQLSYDSLQYTLPISEAADRSLTLALSTAASPYDTDKNKYLKHLKEPETATEFFLTYSQDMGFGELDIAIGKDISDTHNGFYSGIGYQLELPVSTKSGIIINPSMNYQSAQVIDYYYGISQKNATSTLRSDKGKASIDTQLELIYVRELSQHWSAFAGVSSTWFGEGISKRSMVKENSVQQGFAALIYTF